MLTTYCPIRAEGQQTKTSSRSQSEPVAVAFPFGVGEVSISGPLEAVRNSVLHFHHQRFQRLVIQVLYLMFGRAAPTEIPRFVPRDLGSSIGRGLAHVLIREAKDHAAEDVLVHRHALPWTDLDADHPDLAVLEFQLVV